MGYKELLSNYISTSRLTLQEIEDKMKEKGFSTNKAYVSKLQNGKIPPAGEEITRALAEVTGGDPEALVIAAYIEKAPSEVKELLERRKTENEAFIMVEMINAFLKYYVATGTVNEDMLNALQIIGITFSDVTIDINYLKDQPAAASKELLEFAAKKMADYYGYSTRKNVSSSGSDLRPISDVVKEYFAEYTISNSDTSQTKNHPDEEVDQDRKLLIDIVKSISDEDLEDFKILAKRFIRDK